jgi:hypothetical protein
MSKNDRVLELAPTTWYPNGTRRMSSKSSKSGCCLSLLFVMILLISGMIACGGSVDNVDNTQIPQEQVTTEQVTIDSLAVALHEIDSIMNCGRLVHLDVYEIGKIKNVSVSVQKLTAGELSSVWINFRKDCGNDYYYSWEDAHLLNEEYPYFIEAITTILSNKDREVEHEERYAYVTKDDIRFFASATSGKPWMMELSVDYKKQNSTITLAEKDVENLKALIQKGKEKMDEIK